MISSVFDPLPTGHFFPLSHLLTRDEIDSPQYDILHYRTARILSHTITSNSLSFFFLSHSLVSPLSAFHFLYPPLFSIILPTLIMLGPHFLQNLPICFFSASFPSVSIFLFHRYYYYYLATSPKMQLHPVSA